jgi:hypothetical protein
MSGYRREAQKHYGARCWIPFEEGITPDPEKKYVWNRSLFETLNDKQGTEFLHAEWIPHQAHILVCREGAASYVWALYILTEAD